MGVQRVGPFFWLTLRSASENVSLETSQNIQSEWRWQTFVDWHWHGNSVPEPILIATEYSLLNTYKQYCKSPYWLLLVIGWNISFQESKIAHFHLQSCLFSKGSLTDTNINSTHQLLVIFENCDGFRDHSWAEGCRTTVKKRKKKKEKNVHLETNKFGFRYISIQR